MKGKRIPQKDLLLIDVVPKRGSSDVEMRGEKNVDNSSSRGPTMGSWKNRKKIFCVRNKDSARAVARTGIMGKKLGAPQRERKKNDLGEWRSRGNEKNNNQPGSGEGRVIGEEKQKRVA